MDAVDEGDNGGSLSKECKLPLEPFERGSVGDSARSASPALLVRRSSAIFLRRSSGGGSGGWLVVILVRRCGGASRCCVSLPGSGSQPRATACTPIV